MLTLTSSTIVMLIAIALIIGWVIGRRAKRRQAQKIRVRMETQRVHFATKADQYPPKTEATEAEERAPKEKMRRKLPPSRWTTRH